MFAAMATTIINLAFFPTPQFFGHYTWVAKCFAVVEIAFSGALWLLIPKASTKAWLFEGDATTKHQ